LKKLIEGFIAEMIDDWEGQYILNVDHWIEQKANEFASRLLAQVEIYLSEALAREQ
jgi:hypothetical protein